uniref:Ras-related protein RIC2-like n=1 Tax=Petromyzon marinus TaxID=7757 RepID=A0AAJ7SJR1_PETMA|nr:ras-related protein RIC2-like [Petromyzon marinus]
MHRFTADEYKPNMGNIGTSFLCHNLEVGGKNFVMALYGLSGLKSYLSLNTALYRGAQGAMLVYDITNRESFETAKFFLWHLREHHDGAVVMLLGEKSDLEVRRAVATAEAEAFSQEEDLYFMEASALESTNVQEAFLKLLSVMIAKAEREDPSIMAAPPTVEPGKRPGKKGCQVC